MTLPDSFALIHSEFNDFLFAPIGEEGNGMALSVASAMIRLDIDPWQEAARLSILPKELAAATMDGLIGRLPGGRWRRSDIPTIAARLVELLPRGGSAAQSNRAKSDTRAKANLLAVAWLIGIVLGGAMLFGVATNRERSSDNDNTSAPLSSALSPPPAQQ